jgi:hypothetical protein
LRSVISMCAVAMALAGCNAANLPSPGGLAPASRSAHPLATSGGKFTGSYSGTYKVYCVVHGRGSICHFTLAGSGNGSFIGQSNVNAKITCGVGRVWQGRFIFRSEQDSRDAIAIGVPRIAGGCGTRGDYTVKRGAGIFSDASGSGSIQTSGLSQYGSAGTFSSSLNGTLTF